MTTFIIVDTANLFSRARFVVKGDADTKQSMALHIVFNCIKKAWKDFNADHIVFCFEGRSWRKDFYSPYKRNRQETREALTEKELKEEQEFWKTVDDFYEFVDTKTNCTVLQSSRLEADDLIAGWVQLHESCDHVIISTDSDFVQLIAPNVKQYNGISDTLLTHTGHYDSNKTPIVDKKTNTLKLAPNPKWELFVKCIRGDSSDNVFSAFPGVRTKSTKNRIGLTEAFADKETQGYAWNNLMLQRWTDHNGLEHRVIDDYNRNVTLCDLSAQPPEIKDLIRSTVKEKAVSKDISQVGTRLIKYCNKWDLQRILSQVQDYAEPLSAKYENETKH